MKRLLFINVPETTQPRLRDAFLYNVHVIKGVKIDLRNQIELTELELELRHAGLKGKI